MNTGNTAFMMICTALVFFMTPGLAFFYGGLVRRKNVCNTMMACVAIMGLSVLLWTMFGYSLSFCCFQSSLDSVSTETEEAVEEVRDAFSFSF